MPGLLSAMEGFCVIGIVIATGRKASNIGCGSFYAEMAAKDNLMALFCCNTVKCVAPFGGADSLLGTNPIIVAVPAGEERSLILDICMITPDEKAEEIGDMVYGMFNVMITFLNENYRTMMKTIW